jgi:Fe-S cluster assembly iron-binding protein IscA
MQFSFTPMAVRKIQAIMAEKGGALALRIQIRRSAGADKWAMTLEPRTAEALLVDGVPVVVDSNTRSILEGLMIDWVQTPAGPGFGVFDQNLQDVRLRR